MTIIATIILNSLFYPGLLLYSLLVGAALQLPGVALPMLWTPRRVTLRRLRRTIAMYGYGVVRLLPWPWVRVSYEETVRLPPGRGHIFVCNHRSASDPFLMGMIPHRLEVVQVVNVWPMHLPVWGAFARMAGYLSVYEMRTEEYLAQAAELLAAGVSIVLFPEGHRSGGRKLLSFHSSAFRLAQQTGAPLVPLCIAGNERIPAKGSLLLRPGRIRLRQLPPLTPADWAGLTAHQLKLQVRRQMAATLDEMDGTTVLSRTHK